MGPLIFAAPVMLNLGILICICIMYGYKKIPTVPTPPKLRPCTFWNSHEIRQRTYPVLLVNAICTYYIDVVEIFFFQMQEVLFLNTLKTKLFLNKNLCLKKTFYQEEKPRYFWCILRFIQVRNIENGLEFNLLERAWF